MKTARIITPEQRSAYDAIEFARQIGAFRNFCRLSRPTTSYDTIRSAFSDDVTDTAIHRRIRELAVQFWASQQQQPTEQEETRELQPA